MTRTDFVHSLVEVGLQAGMPYFKSSSAEDLDTKAFSRQSNFLILEASAIASCWASRQEYFLFPKFQDLLFDVSIHNSEIFDRPDNSNPKQQTSQTLHQVKVR